MSHAFILKQGKESFLKDRNLWIFSGALETIAKDYAPGNIYPLHSKGGELLAHAYFNMDTSLCGRVLSFGEEDPLQAVYRHLDGAIQLRDRFFNQEVTNAFRLVNGEADMLPGLIIDQYQDALVIQSSTLGMDLLLPKIVSYLVEKKRWLSIFEKSTSSGRKEENLEPMIRTLYGKETNILSILENSIPYKVNWKEGQKTGFFLDQREMRALVGRLSHEKTVLNCFCYTGGFSVAALKGGAKKVDSVDISEAALLMAKENMALSGYKGNTIEADVFEFLRKNSLEYDLVILDPPAFAKKRKDIKNASDGYREINRLTLSKMPKGSLLLTSSCSYYIDEATFQTILFQAALEAQREVQIIGRHIHGIDHPCNLFHKEGGYLKSLLLYLP
jgi:23S rRNA (cytosine1962-C5)-methyltransferase